MKVLDRISVKRIEPYVAIDERGLQTYKQAEQQRNFVGGVIRNVETAIKGLSGFSRENPPEEFVRHIFEFGNINGMVNIKPTKSVSHKDTYMFLLGFVRNELERGTKSVRVEDIVDRYEGWKEEATTETLEQKIIFETPENFEDELGLVTVPSAAEIQINPYLGMEDPKLLPPERAIFIGDNSQYSDLNRQAIVDYFVAKSFHSYLTSEIITPFGKAIKQKALETLGLDEDNLEETAKTMIYSGKRAFTVQVIPRPITPYAKVMNTLFKTAVSRDTKRMGDLTSLSMMQESDELSDVVQMFNATQRGSGLYIYLENLRDRVEELTEEYTTTSKRLEWEYDPLLEVAKPVV